MSTTRDRSVAEDYATKDAQSSMLFRLVVPDFLSCGADISFLSCFPNESEVLFPPATWLRPKGSGPSVEPLQGLTRESSRGQATSVKPAEIRVVEVEPKLGSNRL